MTVPVLFDLRLLAGGGACGALPPFCVSMVFIVAGYFRPFKAKNNPVKRF